MRGNGLQVKCLRVSGKTFMHEDCVLCTSQKVEGVGPY